MEGGYRMTRRFFERMFGKSKTEISENKYGVQDVGVLSHPDLLYRQGESEISPNIIRIIKYNDVELFEVREDVRYSTGGSYSGILRGSKLLTKEEYLKHFESLPWYGDEYKPITEVRNCNFYNEEE